ncbi:hypothetical protein QFZ77_006717 [Paenibacillus sp. V4I3]|nr:hypothetical protein [Paenibacillus sp. V4I3]MDQ0886118.1 hypothetical protein [Paenibacillus sp. V4I9]
MAKMPPNFKKDAINPPCSAGNARANWTEVTMYVDKSARDAAKNIDHFCLPVVFITDLYMK